MHVLDVIHCSACVMSDCCFVCLVGLLGGDRSYTGPRLHPVLLSTFSEL